MGYSTAMEAAGATVLQYESFGSWQGDWWAKVEFGGKQHWVHGSYGSCSGCDAFQSAFDYDKGETCSEHRYDEPKEPCADCAVASADYQSRLAAFGLSYLTGNEYTQEEAEKATEPDGDKWNYDEKKEQYAFITAHPLNPVLPIEVDKTPTGRKFKESI